MAYYRVNFTFYFVWSFALKHCLGSAIWLPQFASVRLGYRLGSGPQITDLSTFPTHPSLIVISDDGSFTARQVRIKWVM